MAIIFILFGVGLCAAFIVKALYFPVLYPTRSSSRELTLVLYGGFYPNSPMITLKHYIDEVHVEDYVLTIENGIRIQEPQSYRLPKLDEGAVVISVELQDEVNSVFTIIYSQASDLYRTGLLIYLYTDFNSSDFVKEGIYFRDKYVHFISGRHRTTYFLSGEDRAYFLNNGNSPEWSIITNSPRLRMIPRNDAPYLVWYSGWKENEWIETNDHGQ